jgi:large subunit ribosomal protein L9
MKVILREDVPHLGVPGAIVRVKPGYARNYLIPQGLAAIASSRNIKMMEHNLKKIQRQIDAAKEKAGKVKEALEKLEITISKPAGDQEKLFGSVTTRDVAAALNEEGILIDRKRIIIPEPIKALGVYTVQVKLYGGELSDLKVWVVKA